ncbi:NUDIX hydrolase family protein [Micrococcales bacterium 31B]|nr:NUDIX hydrolase family protein [Micrococcales bacterium 31B]
MVDTAVDSDDTYFTPEELAYLRKRVPMSYVDIVPVRVDTNGAVTSVGLLVRGSAAGRVTYSLVSGRVMFHERLRDAIVRHLEKDLGSLALPRVPATLQPFTVAEYLPTPGASRFHDPRQHAISLAYVVPISGDCAPRQDALEIAWLTPLEARDAADRGEMTPGHDLLVTQALAHCQVM